MLFFLKAYVFCSFVCASGLMSHHAHLIIYTSTGLGDFQRPIPIHVLSTHLGKSLCKVLLALHKLTGVITPSSLEQKVLLLKRLQENVSMVLEKWKLIFKIRSSLQKSTSTKWNRMDSFVRLCTSSDIIGFTILSVSGMGICSIFASNSNFAEYQKPLEDDEMMWNVLIFNKR